MVSALTWVLAGVVLYTAVMMALRAQNLLPSSVRVSGPITTLHTKRGREFLDWLATPKRFWRAWGNLGVGVFLVVMAVSFLVVILSAVSSMLQPEATTQIRQPQNVLVIPGVNDFLPAAAAPEIVFGLVVALVVHEGGHGLLCRVEDIDIDSMGLAFLTFIPMGAFVEPDVESRNEADRGSQVRMFSAGIMNNFAISFVAFVLLFGPVIGSIAVVSGVPVGAVTDGSAAAEAGLERGDVITSVDGKPVENDTELQRRLQVVDDERVRIGRKDGSTVEVRRSLLITRAVLEVMGDVEVSPDKPTRVTAVNGTAVHTQRGFAREVSDRPVVRLETTRGNTTLPIGAYVFRVSEDGPLAAAGAPTNDTSLIVTHVAGERTANTSDLERVLSGTDPGTTVPVVAYVDGERRTYNVTLEEDPNGEGGFLGVFVTPGYSGIVMTDFGVQPYPAEQFLLGLGGASGPLGGLLDGNFLDYVITAVRLPFLSVIPGVGSAFDFAGFIPPVAEFYTATGPLGFLGGGVLMLANVLFWTAWINVQVAFFNCIPTYPLDGGHVLRASVESIVSRLPLPNRRRVTTAATASVSLIMIAALVLMVFGPQLFRLVV